MLSAIRTRLFGLGLVMAALAPGCVVDSADDEAGAEGEVDTEPKTLQPPNAKCKEQQAAPPQAPYPGYGYPYVGWSHWNLPGYSYYPDPNCPQTGWDGWTGWNGCGRYPYPGPNGNYEEPCR